MSNMYGADVAELRRLASEFRTAADELDRDGGQLTRLLNGVDWIGGVASRFTNQWTGVQLPRINLSTRFLRDAADELSRNADQQQQASRTNDAANVRGGIVPRSLLATPTPGQTASEWWSSLSPSERREILDQRPDLAMADGIPPDDRIEATRKVMELRRSELRTSGADPAELERLEEWLKDPNRQFLLYDPIGDGRVAEVFGSLRTADAIAVVIPGISNDIGNFDNLRTNAISLHGDDSERAVVAWLGYDTPGQVDLQTLSTARATSAGADLAAFTAGLRSTVGGELTVVAHSYGTVVATRAAQAGMEVDRVVLLGSPGVPANHASVFNGADVYVMNNGGDPIPSLDNAVTSTVETELLRPVLGPLAASVVAHHVAVPYPHADMLSNTDPSSSSFGATVLDGNYRGFHSDYFEGEELDRIRDVASSRPTDTGSSVIHRSVDSDGNVVVSEVPKF